jgi:hypothetical protein
VRGKLDGKNFVVAKKAQFVPNAVMAFSACTSCVPSLATHERVSACSFSPTACCTAW